MPTYKLTYFDNRLRAEPIRWLFAVAGQPYEDKRISFSEWPKIKAGNNNKRKLDPRVVFLEMNFVSIKQYRLLPLHLIAM